MASDICFSTAEVLTAIGAVVTAAGAAVRWAVARMDTKDEATLAAKDEILAILERRNAELRDDRAELQRQLTGGDGDG